MKQLPYPSRRRHLPVVAFLACVSWLWSLVPASANQDIEITISIQPMGSNINGQYWAQKDRGQLTLSSLILTDENIVFTPWAAYQRTGPDKGTFSGALFFDKSGGTWKCRTYDVTTTVPVRICSAIRVASSGGFLIDYVKETKPSSDDLPPPYRLQFQYSIDLTTSGDCKIQLLSTKMTEIHHGNIIDYDTSAWTKDSSCWVSNH